jgi:hypothetical protein
MKYLTLFITMLFAGELEVDGNLKVTGTVDANGNPITNVGPAISMTDAINGTNYWIANWYNSGGRQVQNSNPKLYLLPGNSIAASTTTTKYILTIFEYPISSSGTSQGMNYIEP